jgi:RHS repeat-associated protein
LYYRAFGVLAELVTGATSARWNEYLSVGNQMVGVRFVDGVGTATPTVLTRYFHTDHLGSIALLTNEAGALAQRLSYDPWGKRRFNNGADDFPGSLSSTTLTTRGFTGEEELSIGGLVHLNGRVYDPMLARMVSADPVVPDALNAQAWNRYSYVGNSPLTFTDPSGHSWLSSFFGSVGSFFKSILSNPIVRAVVQIALATILAPLGPIGAAISAAAVTGLAGGSLSDVANAAALAGLTSVGFNLAGNLTNMFPGANPGPMGEHGIPDFGSQAHAFSIASHAGIGCLSSVAAGGNCGSGALAGGVSAAASPVMPSNVFAHAAVGGLASVAGGGKFANGAVTGAFGYLYNEMGNYRERGYEPTYYGDEICNGGSYPGSCGPSTFGVTDPTSPWLENLAALTGAGRALRLISSVFSRDALPQWPGNDPTRGPSGTEWRGRPGSTLGSPEGNFYNPTTTESYRPDLSHGGDIGPHWDYRSPKGDWSRIFPDGRVIPK